MSLHRKKHYDQRRWLMEQPFEKQEKAKRRLDYFFYAIIAVAVVVAMSFSLFKSHNIGRTVLFFLFLIWWTYFALKSDLHRIAKKKGWETVAKLTYDEKTEKRREEVMLRHERLENPVDTDTLVLVENVTDPEELEIILFDYVEVECKTLCDDLPLLWKVGEYRYAVTFPCGISRKPFYELMDNLICFLIRQPFMVGAGPISSREMATDGSSCALGVRICSSPIQTTVLFGTSTPQTRYSVTRTQPTGSKNFRPSIGTLPNSWGYIISTYFYQRGATFGLFCVITDRYSC